jgi:hypothetical protein
VVRGLRGRIGAQDGTAAGCEGEGDSAVDAFCCAAGWRVRKGEEEVKGRG